MAGKRHSREREAEEREKSRESAAAVQQAEQDFLERAQEFLGDPLHGVRLGIHAKDDAASKTRKS